MYQMPMEADGVDKKDHNKALLYADTDHVDVQVCEQVSIIQRLVGNVLTIQDLGACDTISLSTCCSIGLDDKCASHSQSLSASQKG